MRFKDFAVGLSQHVGHIGEMSAAEITEEIKGASYASDEEADRAATQVIQQYDGLLRKLDQ